MRGDKFRFPPGRGAVTIYESCADANNALGPCPNALAESDGGHWWYIDDENDAEADRWLQDGEEIPYILCECKSCPQRMKLSVDAEEYPPA